MTILVAGLCALAAWLAVPPTPTARLRALCAEGVRRPGRPRAVPPWLAALAAGVGTAVLAGPVAGMLVGLGAFALLPRVAARLQSDAVAGRHRALQRQLPDAVDLLAATLAAGAPIASAIRAVGEAQVEPLHAELGRVAAALELGAPAAEAWRAADAVDGLAEVAGAFRRSAQSGAPLSELLSGLAADLRLRRRTAVEVAAREAGVRAFAPLAACFLPAFVLVAGVPTVVAMAASTGLLTSLSP